MDPGGDNCREFVPCGIYLEGDIESSEGSDTGYTMKVTRTPSVRAGGCERRTNAVGISRPGRCRKMDAKDAKRPLRIRVKKRLCFCVDLFDRKDVLLECGGTIVMMG